MDQSEKRQLENELITMGLPGLDDPALIQTMADIVNAYPAQGERVEYFCELLNQCEGAKRREMYEALRPRLHFEVPSLDVCEARIAMRAERRIRPQSLPGTREEDGLVERTLEIECGHCHRKRCFTEMTTASAMLAAKRAGWGRGPLPGIEYCPDCRLLSMMGKRRGDSYTKRFGDAVEA